MKTYIKCIYCSKFNNDGYSFVNIYEDNIVCSGFSDNRYETYTTNKI